LSELFLKLEETSEELDFLHIVQTRSEKRKIESRGRKVVLCLENLKFNPSKCSWTEPSDFRKETGLEWDPIQLDRHLVQFNTKKKRAIAASIFTALEKLFEEHDIDGVLSEPVALFPTQVLLYLCKTQRALPLFWANSYLPNRFYFSDKINISQPSRLSSKFQEANAVSIEEISAFFDQIKSDSAGPVYHHKFSTKQTTFDYFRQRRGEKPLVLKEGNSVRVLQLMRTVRAAAARLFFPSKFDYMTAASFREHLFYMQNLLSSRKGYDALSLNSDTKHIMFPLQYEPEASLLYAAPDFRDQRALVKQICEQLPVGKTLWVKEHPNQFGVLRHHSWREIKRSHNNLKFVHGRENGRKLISNCELVVTISSSAGMDALVIGKPVVVLGDVFYQNFSGAHKMKSLRELAEFLHKVSFVECIPDREKLVMSFQKFVHECYLGDPQPSSTLYSDSNLQNLKTAILAELTEKKQNEANDKKSPFEDRKF
jgi:hypothetical protein